MCGMNDDRIQRRLLSEIDLTFEKAFKIAIAAETAGENAQDLQKAAVACNSMKTEGNETRGEWRNKETDLRESRAHRYGL